jgi:hypothetical protein
VLLPRRANLLGEITIPQEALACAMRRVGRDHDLMGGQMLDQSNAARELEIRVGASKLPLKKKLKPLLEVLADLTANRAE